MTDPIRSSHVQQPPSRRIARGHLEVMRRKTGLARLPAARSPEPAAGRGVRPDDLVAAILAALSERSERATGGS